MTAPAGCISAEHPANTAGRCAAQPSSAGIPIAASHAARSYDGSISVFPSARALKKASSALVLCSSSSRLACTSARTHAARVRAASRARFAARTRGSISSSSESESLDLDADARSDAVDLRISSWKNCSRRRCFRAALLSSAGVVDRAGGDFAIDDARDGTPTSTEDRAGDLARDGTYSPSTDDRAAPTRDARGFTIETSPAADPSPRDDLNDAAFDARDERAEERADDRSTAPRDLPPGVGAAFLRRTTLTLASFALALALAYRASAFASALSASFAIFIASRISRSAGVSASSRVGSKLLLIASLSSRHDALRSSSKPLNSSAEARSASSARPMEPRPAPPPPPPPYSSGLARA